MLNELQSARDRYPLDRQLWLTPRARAAYGDGAGQALGGSARIVALAADAAAPTGPAVILMMADDVADDGLRAQLEHAARAAQPGRPVIAGGDRNRDILLESINRWHAFRLIADDAPTALLGDVVGQAFDALHTEYALDLAAREYRTEHARLRQSIEQLERTESETIKNNKLAALGRFAGELFPIVRQALGKIELLVEASQALQAEPWFASLREGALLGFRATDRLLSEMSELAETHELRFEPAPLDLRQLCSQALSFCKHDPEAAGITIALEADDEHPVRASVDRYRFFHVLVNLLRNAIQASPSHSTVTVSLATEARTAVIEVRDAGTGVPDELSESLFTPFASGKGARGLGLGLYMSRLTVDRHGGTITYVGAPGQGACFRICLPALDHAASD